MKINVLYILNTRIKKKSSLENSLQKIYGTGRYTSKIILKLNGLLNIRGIILREKHVTRLQQEFNNCKKPFSRDLKQIELINCQRLITNGTYRGTRHKLGFPVRGQRTKTNSSTQKQLYLNRLPKLFKPIKILLVKKLVKPKKKKIQKKKIPKKTLAKKILKAKKYKV